MPGRPFCGQVARGEAVKIMTGAVMPTNTDTVMMQEYVEITNTILRTRKVARQGQNVRQAGEDILQRLSGNKSGETDYRCRPGPARLAGIRQGWHF